jgi:hypothetical protein
VNSPKKSDQSHRTIDGDIKLKSKLNACVCDSKIRLLKGS